MPQDSIMDMVNNVEPLYNDKMAMFARWVEEGDAWSKALAHRQAHALARHFATALQESDMVEGEYKLADFKQAADEMVEEFEEYREEAIKAAVETVTRTPKPEDLELDPGDIEHAKKYEGVAQKIGIDLLRGLIPASPERIRKALERGDKHLNTIPLRKWDIAATGIPTPGLSLSEKVCALKYVAKWRYA